MHVFTDDCVQDICARIAGVIPEAGGALMGPRDSHLVTDLVFDRWAVTTAVTYQPSRELAREVRDIEAAGDLVLRGIIHSHPGSYDRPSMGDLQAFAELLAANSHLSSVLVPIVCRRSSDGRSLAAHELALGPVMKLAGFEASRAAPRRTRTGCVVKAEVHPVKVTVGSFDEAAQAVASELYEAFLAETTPVIRTSRMSVNGGMHVAKLIEFDHAELVLLFAPSFPFGKPVALLSIGGTTREIVFPWASFGASPASALADCLVPIIAEAMRPIPALAIARSINTALTTGDTP